jgi:hypothetical protein
MIERIRITVLTITCICIFTYQSQAGVITVENNRVTKATLSDGTTNINVQFVADSYDNVTSGQNPIEIMPWFSDQTKALALAQDLTSALNAYESDNSISLPDKQFYMFADSLVNSSQVNTTLVARSSYWEVIANDFTADRAETANIVGSTFIYAIQDTGGNSSVPEPSTAIAMGLLGILSFAGNRRRRRQESVA